MRHKLTKRQPGYNENTYEFINLCLMLEAQRQVATQRFQRWFVSQRV